MKKFLLTLGCAALALPTFATEDQHKPNEPMLTVKMELLDANGNKEIGQVYVT